MHVASEGTNFRVGTHNQKFLSVWKVCRKYVERLF